METCREIAGIYMLLAPPFVLGALESVCVPTLSELQIRRIIVHRSAKKRVAVSVILNCILFVSHACSRDNSG